MVRQQELSSALDKAVKTLQTEYRQRTFRPLMEADVASRLYHLFLTQSTDLISAAEIHLNARSLSENSL